jgi:anti-sigma28 factor (negative regulator of flagellin synthesis)
MDINRITNGGLPPDPLKVRKAKDDSDKVRSKEDRIELSDEAVSLFNAQDDKRLEEIRKKVDSGYYFQRDITEKVVDSMLRDLKTQ